MYASNRPILVRIYPSRLIYTLSSPISGLEALVDQKTLVASRGKVRIVPSSVGVDAGAIGAAVLASMM